MKTELRILFCSPIAWLILIVFAFQAGYCLWDLMDSQLKTQLMGGSLYAVSTTILSGMYGLMTMMLRNLYLYIPLLTMGMMSRELSSGSIKLLYSSSASNFQIILGKYLSTMVYGLALNGVLILGALVVFAYVKSPDISAVLVALLGFYLTICAYSAIGLFLSTITHYQVVAAMGTLVVLASLNFIGEVGQSIDFVRDLTYWLSISGRSSVFMDGMICSQDLLYFILVILLFLALSVVKLKSERQSVSRLINTGRYLGVIVVVLLLGYLSSRPSMIKYYDATSTKRNTLTEESQRILSGLNGSLTINSYVNILDPRYYIGMPDNRNRDKAKFVKYFRFKPEIKMNYIYYYDKAENSYLDNNFPDLNEKERMLKLSSIYNYNPKMFISPEEIKKQIDLSGEKNTFVREIVSENGRKIFLRVYNDNITDPGEIEITTALKTLLVSSPEIGFVTGHGERTISNSSNNGYSAFAVQRDFRYSLINQGFNVSNVELNQPVDVDILILSDMRSAYTEQEMKNYNDFLERGGNLIILGEPKRQAVMNPLLAPLGLKLTDDLLVQPSKTYLDDLVLGYVTDESVGAIASLSRMKPYSITMPTTCGIEYLADSSIQAFTMTEILRTKDKGVWNEKETVNFVDEKSVCNPAQNEIEKSYPVMVRLARMVNSKEQRIFVTGDADCFSSGEMSVERGGIRSNNFGLIPVLLKNLTYDAFPVTMSRETPPDNELHYTQDILSVINIVFIWVIPILLTLIYIWIWHKRQNR